MLRKEINALSAVPNGKGSRLRPVEFHTMSVNVAVSFRLEAGRASFPNMRNPLAESCCFLMVIRELYSILKRKRVI